MPTPTLRPEDLAPLPFRTRARTAGKADLARANREASRNGEAAWRPYKEERWAMEHGRQGGVEVSPAMVERWLTHPDERVAGDLAHHLALVGGVEERVKVRLALYDRATLDARADEVVWTPLLDAIAHAGSWPSHEGAVELHGEGRHVRPVSLSDWLSDLEPWLREQETPLFLRALCTFRAPQVSALAVRHVPRLDAEVLGLLARDPGTWGEVARNPAFSAEAETWMVAQTVQLLQGGKSPGETARAVRGWDEVRRSGRPVPPPLLGDLLGVLEKLPKSGSRQAELGDALFKLLCMSMGLTPEQLSRLYTCIRQNRQHRASYLNIMVLGPSSGPELWARIRRDFARNPDAMASLASFPPARQHAETRAWLAKSRVPTVLKLLCADASGEELRSLFHRLAVASQADALSALDAMRDVQLADLGESGLGMLLFSPDESVRLTAMRHVGRIGAAARSVGTPPSGNGRGPASLESP